MLGGKKFIWTSAALLPLFLTAMPVLSTSLTADPAAWTRVDRIVAVIDGKPVLESDVLMEVDLGLLGSSQLGNDFEKLLEAYLNRTLILKEVEEVGGFRLTAGQVEGAYRGYLQRFGSPEEYRAKLYTWGIAEEDVKHMLRRALLASLYTESRIQFFVNILPSDIEKAYEEERERWGELTLYEAWETIKAYLQQITYRDERDRWLAALRERYDQYIPGSDGDAQK